MMLILASTLVLLVAGPTWKDSIAQEGWVQIIDRGEAVYLLKRSNAPWAYWLRMETKTSSLTALMRCDCSAYTTQIAQTFSYSRPNMTGEIEENSTPSAAKVPPPDSILDFMLKTVCEG